MMKVISIRRMLQHKMNETFADMQITVPTIQICMVPFIPLKGVCSDVSPCVRLAPFCYAELCTMAACVRGESGKMGSKVSFSKMTIIALKGYIKLTEIMLKHFSMFHFGMM